MTVGGTIVGVTIRGDEAHVTVQERAYWKPGKPLNPRSSTSIWVKHAGQPLSVGDYLWWQGIRAMYTPQKNRVSNDEARRIGLRDGLDFDIVLERTSYSHSGHGWPQHEGFS